MRDSKRVGSRQRSLHPLILPLRERPLLAGVATAVKLCARCTTLKAARALATNFARATLRKLSTGFLFKLFNAQFLDFASLRVLFLVVGSFFNVFSVM